MNPRYPFGVYTISNRARSASYATSPCTRIAARLRYNSVSGLICQALFSLFRKKKRKSSGDSLWTFVTVSVLLYRQRKRRLRKAAAGFSSYRGGERSQHSPQQSVTSMTVGLSGNISPASISPTASVRVSTVYQMQLEFLSGFVKGF